MAVVFDHPKSLLDVSTHFCPGCGHGIVHRLVCEVIDEMGIEGDTIGVVPVGCSVMSYNYFGCDVIEAPHGRAPAVATGAKRVNPDKFVFSYQGDGDLAAALAQRVAIDSVPHIREAKKAIRKAFENEKEKRGLSIIEVLSTCPTNWGMSPTESMQFVKDKMIPYYPLGVYKDVTAEEGAKA